MNAHIFHLTSQNEWHHAKLKGAYKPADFDREGFIHCSYKDQLLAVANRRFRGRTDLLVLVIEPAKLDCKVIDENLEGGSECFPHIYGVLPIRAVADSMAFPCDAEGYFSLPWE
jgi:uncharacterized protein (DUF952 family)